MSYIKQTWKTGELISKEKLNHIEEGIGNSLKNNQMNNIPEPSSTSFTLYTLQDLIKELVRSGIMKPPNA